MFRSLTFGKFRRNEQKDIRIPIHSSLNNEITYQHIKIIIVYCRQSMRCTTNSSSQCFVLLQKEKEKRFHFIMGDISLDMKSNLLLNVNINCMRIKFIKLAVCCVKATIRSHNAKGFSHTLGKPNNSVLFKKILQRPLIMKFE